MPNQVNIDRCYCLNTRFNELKKYHALEEIKSHTGCGTKCALCVIYLVEMLETGKTEFDEPLY